MIRQQQQSQWKQGKLTNETRAQLWFCLKIRKCVLGPPPAVLLCGAQALGMAVLTGASRASLYKACGACHPRRTVCFSKWRGPGRSAVIWRSALCPVELSWSVCSCPTHSKSVINLYPKQATSFSQKQCPFTLTFHWLVPTAVQ